MGDAVTLHALSGRTASSTFRKSSERAITPAASGTLPRSRQTGSTAEVLRLGPPTPDPTISADLCRRQPPRSRKGPHRPGRRRLPRRPIDTDRTIATSIPGPTPTDAHAGPAAPMPVTVPSTFDRLRAALGRHRVAACVRGTRRHRGAARRLLPPATGRPDDRSDRRRLRRAGGPVHDRRDGHAPFGWLDHHRKHLPSRPRCCRLPVRDLPRHQPESVGFVRSRYHLYAARQPVRCSRSSSSSLATSFIRSTCGARHQRRSRRANRSPPTRQRSTSRSCRPGRRPTSICEDVGGRSQ